MQSNQAEISRASSGVGTRTSLCKSSLRNLRASWHGSVSVWWFRSLPLDPFWVSLLLASYLVGISNCTLLEGCASKSSTNQYMQCSLNHAGSFFVPWILGLCNFLASMRVRVSTESNLLIHLWALMAAYWGCIWSKAQEIPEVKVNCLAGAYSHPGFAHHGIRLRIVASYVGYLTRVNAWEIMLHTTSSPKACIVR